MSTVQAKRINEWIYSARISASAPPDQLNIFIQEISASEIGVGINGVLILSYGFLGSVRNRIQFELMQIHWKLMGIFFFQMVGMVLTYAMIMIQFKSSQLQ
jgi:hypothetical protein